MPRRHADLVGVGEGTIGAAHSGSHLSSAVRSEEGVRCVGYGVCTGVRGGVRGSAG